jgi:hypothetical protein
VPNVGVSAAAAYDRLADGCKRWLASVSALRPCLV